MALKPWYKVVSPRDDLREGRPLDASEFAVHLDQVRDGRAPSVYQKPKEFFERTYMTENLKILASQVLRRLSGVKVETSAVFNMATQFGGGKTHALTLLYHLAQNGDKSLEWQGVSAAKEMAKVKSISKAATAVFVGTEFDSLTGRGGDDGTPLRRTPWGEIAFQLGGAEALKIVAKHDKEVVAPSGEVIRKFLPKNRPSLILMDELMNFVSRSRKSGLAGQLYSFLQNLSEEVRAQDNVVLVVSIPASELEMSADDQSDYERFKKLLDRVGKAMIISAEAETSEIIRRRLFEWGGLPDDAQETAHEYAEWVLAHRQQVPSTFPVDNAQVAFEAAYPFHPSVLSVFERKWQALPRFQQTRGILRLLALWVSKAYQDGYKGSHKDPLISLGTAPLEDSMFRAAAFEQLGDSKLEGAVTTDITGKRDANAVRLDKEAVESIRKTRLHQKVATSIFFESNGGQSKTEATLPEIRMAVGEPDLDTGNVDAVLESLAESCYFLSSERNRYRFSTSPNLNKLLADRRASIQPGRIKDAVHSEIQKVFASGAGVERIFFPEDSGQIPDSPCLALIVLDPQMSMAETRTREFVDSCNRQHGKSGRTFKSALIWAVPEDSSVLREEARKYLAWCDIQDEADDLHLEESQKRLLAQNVQKAQRDLREAVWRTYKYAMLLGKNGEWKTVDFGLVHSSAANTMVELIINRLEKDGDLIKDSPSPSLLTRNWPAFKEWNTKAVRDAFFASPLFPRLMNSESVKETICRGISNMLLGYAGKGPDGSYSPFYFGDTVSPQDIELSEDVFIVSKEVAQAYQAGKSAAVTVQTSLTAFPEPEKRKICSVAEGEPPKAAVKDLVKKISWEGEIPPQKWMNFYTKVLSKFAVTESLHLKLAVEVISKEGVSRGKVEETKFALRELGLNDRIETESRD